MQIIGEMPGRGNNKTIGPGMYPLVLKESGHGIH